MYIYPLISRGIAMFQMFRQFFSMITVLFTAGEKLAKSADNLATWAEESTGAFSDQARIERAKKLALINKPATTKALPKPKA